MEDLDNVLSDPESGEEEEERDLDNSTGEEYSSAKKKHAHGTGIRDNGNPVGES